MDHNEHFEPKQKTDEANSQASNRLLGCVFHHSQTAMDFEGQHIPASVTDGLHRPGAAFNDQRVQVLDEKGKVASVNYDVHINGKLYEDTYKNGKEVSLSKESNSDNTKMVPVQKGSREYNAVHDKLDDLRLNLDIRLKCSEL